MLFQEKLDKIREKSKVKGIDKYDELRVEREKLSRRDIWGLVLSAYIVFAPIFLVLILILILVY